MEYEVIVVGGGHAGCEAALATAKKNHKTLLVTGRIENIATMPCNPSIGGSAKGIVVREIDALGGMMGKVADKSLLQIKMLNYLIENIEDGFESTITKILTKAEREVGKEFSNYSNARIFAMNGKLMGRYTTRLYVVSEEEMPEICQKLKKFNLFPANR